jgi:dimethylhistidine N-methyltransferase
MSNELLIDSPVIVPATRSPVAAADQPPSFLDVAVLGLQASRDKMLPYALLYDNTGSELFEAICELPEYYPTREERRLIVTEADRIVATFPENCIIVELGCGSASKTKHILEAFIQRHGSAHFVALDISAGALDFAADELRGLLGSTRLRVTPICADYVSGLYEISKRWPSTPIVVLWLGGSIGNMERPEAASFLSELTRILHPAVTVVGIDIWKSPSVLHDAYHDKAGVTERFIKNILVRLNHDLQADFHLDAFRYQVKVSEEHHRVEMYLQSTRAQRVTLRTRGRTHIANFAAGELVLVEYSHKYTVEEAHALSSVAGLHLLLPLRSDLFSLNVFVPKDSTHVQQA